MTEERKRKRRKRRDLEISDTHVKTETHGALTFLGREVGVNVGQSRPQPAFVHKRQQSHAFAIKATTTLFKVCI